MSVSRASLTGGPAYAEYNSLNIQFLADSSVRTDKLTDVISAALYGDFDYIDKDMIVKASGTPLFYDTAQLAALFPYTAGAMGTTYPPTSTNTCTWNSNNGDTIAITNPLIGKMPDFTLGVDGPVLGPMEIWGLPAYGDDPATANSYYTKSTGNSFSNPAVPDTAFLGRQEFTAAWGEIGGFTAFQAQEKWTITHNLKLAPFVVQGRTFGFRLASYSVMAKCTPVGPSMAQIDAALYGQGSGSGSGRRESVNSANLVITGSNNMTVTIGNAALVTAGDVFASEKLRHGELGWVSTLNIASGGAPSQAALTLA